MNLHLNIFSTGMSLLAKNTFNRISLQVNKYSKEDANWQTCIIKNELTGQKIFFEMGLRDKLIFHEMSLHAQKYILENELMSQTFYGMCLQINILRNVFAAINIFYEMS